MGDALGLFCDGFAGEVFNRDGDIWPETDVTLVDLAHFAREGYEARALVGCADRSPQAVSAHTGHGCYRFRPPGGEVAPTAPRSHPAARPTGRVPRSIDICSAVGNETVRLYPA